MPAKKTTRRPTSRSGNRVAASAKREPGLQDLSIEELLAENNRLSEERGAIRERQREIADELDRRTADIENRRRADAALLGQV